MGAGLGTKNTMSEINMTPLIDIVLVVLIIMMVNMPIEIETLGVKLPSNKPPSDPPPDKVEQLVIMLYEDGKVALNRQQIDDESMFFEITRRLRPMEKKIVFIDAHPKVPFTRVVDAIDLGKEAGAIKIAFAKLKETGPLEPTSVAPGARPKGVYAGSPAVVGAITEKKADEQFRPLLGPIRDCYDIVLQTNRTLSGRLLVKLGVWPEGEVISQEILGSTMEAPELEACILEAAPALTFEPLGEGNTASVQVPLLFAPG
jgi:biopolymer transport protein ExbD